MNEPKPQPHEIDQFEATLREDNKNAAGFDGWMHRRLDARMVHYLRKGQGFEEAEISTVTWGCFWIGFLAGVIALALLLGTLSWTWGMEESFGFVGKLTAWSIIGVAVTIQIVGWRRRHGSKGN